MYMYAALVILRVDVYGVVAAMLRPLKKGVRRSYYVIASSFGIVRPGSCRVFSACICRCRCYLFEEPKQSVCTSCELLALFCSIYY